MTITTLSSREFNQDTGRAKRAAEKGPVVITNRGKPAHVLLSMEEYRRLSGRKGKSLLEALAPDNPEEHDFDFDPPKLDDMGFKPVDFD